MDFTTGVEYEFLDTQPDARSLMHVKLTEDMDATLREHGKRRRLDNAQDNGSTKLTLRFMNEKRAVFTINGQQYEASMAALEQGQGSFDCVQLQDNQHVIGIGKFDRKLACKAQLTARLTEQTKLSTEKTRVSAMTKEVNPPTGKRKSKTTKVSVIRKTPIISTPPWSATPVSTPASTPVSTPVATPVSSSRHRNAPLQPSRLNPSSRTTTPVNTPTAAAEPSGAAARPVSAAPAQQPSSQPPTQSRAQRKPNNVALRDWTVHILAIRPVDKTQISNKFVGCNSSELRKVLNQIGSVKKNRYRLTSQGYKELLLSPLLASYSDEDWASVLKTCQAVGQETERLEEKRKQLLAVKRSGTTGGGGGGATPRTPPRSSTPNGFTPMVTAQRQRPVVEIPPIQTAEELLHRRQEFSTKFEVYQALKKELDVMAQEFIALGNAVKEAAPGSSARRKTAQRLHERYESQVQDFEQKQEQFAQLHEELKAIKKRIKEHNKASA